MKYSAGGFFMLATLQGVSALLVGGAKVAGPSSRTTKAAMQLQTLSDWSLEEITPNYDLVQRVYGTSRKTWKFADTSQDRVQVCVTSEGRPVHSEMELWIGPDWTPFSLKAYSEDGYRRPIQTTIGTRNRHATIEVRNVADYEFPFNAAVNYAKGPMAQIHEMIPTASEEQGAGGFVLQGTAIRSFPISPGCQQFEVVLKTDGRQLNAKMELLNGPNNRKQTYEVFTNNGVLNSLCVAFNTPSSDEGYTVRIQNLATVEFPCNIHINEKF